jgi:hypothetical protein
VLIFKERNGPRGFQMRLGEERRKASDPNNFLENQFSKK